MFTKALTTAAAAAILVSGFAGAANATSTRIVIGEDGARVVVRDHRAPKVRDHRTKVVVRDHRSKVVVRDHRTKDKVRDHRTPRRNEVVRIGRPKLDCRLGAQKLWKQGYESIRAYDCRGVSYSYRAMMGHGIFNASMNAYSGQMTVEFVGIAH